jgi:hypothetical protein
MAVTIDSESKSLSKLLIDVDKYRNIYSTESSLENGDTVTVNFVSPYIKVYEEFKFYLIKNSTRKKLSPKNFFRPDYVSYEEYSTTVFWNLLLFVNNVSSIEMFNLDEILVPSKAAVNFLVNYVVLNNKVKDINPPVKLFNNKDKAKAYALKSQPTLQDIPAPTVEIDAKFYFMRQTFPIRTVTVAQRFLDLKYEAVAESLVMRIKDQPSFAYGKDYILLEVDGKMTRVSWSKDFVEVGLEDLIVEGQIVEISYARKV